MSPRSSWIMGFLYLFLGLCSFGLAGLGVFMRGSLDETLSSAQFYQGSGLTFAQATLLMMGVGVAGGLGLCGFGALRLLSARKAGAEGEQE